MKKNYGLFVGFIVIVLGLIAFGVFYVFGNVGSKEYVFNKDGYALYVNEKENYKAQSLSFTNGSVYTYKKSNNKIVFKSSNEGNVSIDDSTLVHYTDDSLLVLKNVVGLDLTTIDNELIFYYNIYKNTNINYDNGNYTITSLTGEKINFNNMLIRVTDSKYLFVSDSVRVAIGEDETVDFGKYAYIEYNEGAIVGVYNNSKNYQSIGENMSIVSGDITINLADKTISKKGEKYITLSNLVLNSDSNIDLIPQEEGTLPNINKPGVDTTIPGGEGNSVENNNTIGKPDNNVNDEVVEEEGKITKMPVFKVSDILITPISFDARLDIQDDDQIITLPTEISIVNNSTLEVMYEKSLSVGETNTEISVSGLSPDTEYTLYAKAGYEIDENDYSRSFVNKIFRTEAIGVSFKKSYAKSDALVIDVIREDYSNVNSLKIFLCAPGSKVGPECEDKDVTFDETKSRTAVVFNELDSNTEYLVVMKNIKCGGHEVEEGYSEEKTMYTLKNAPSISELDFLVNKRDATFELSIGDVSDPDYGIVSYRYEIFKIDQDMSVELPLVILESDDLKTVKVNVDGKKLDRGSSYTYRLVTIFNDNEKIIEYVKYLDGVMRLDGVDFPIVRFVPTDIKHESIKGKIVIEDDQNTVVGDNYKVFIKEAGVEVSKKELNVHAADGIILIDENHLRSNTSYSFLVHASVNLQDGNVQYDDAYIGGAVVKTLIPNPVVVNLSDENSDKDLSKAFSITLDIDDPEGSSSVYEASTMNTLLVEIYQGKKDSNGDFVARRLYKDSQPSYYQSSIKDLFYSNSFTITPDFFGLDNSAFNQTNYTIKVLQIEDYTGYEENRIPIAGGIIDFTTNEPPPDAPGGSNAVIVTEIRNKSCNSFNLKCESDLDGETVIGYSVVANYPNERKNAQKIIYHVWRYDVTNKKWTKLTSQEIPFGADGVVPSHIFPVDYGIKDGTSESDTTLRRGNIYYFSYQIEVLYDNGETIVFPDEVDGEERKSDEIRCLKQRPSYLMYPSVSTNSSATWNYKIKDVDQALMENKLYAYFANDLEVKSSPNVEVNKDHFNVVKFTSLRSNSAYDIKSKIVEINGENAKDDSIVTKYLYSYSESLNLDYTAEIDKKNNNLNKLIVSILDYDNYKDKIDNFSGIDITISAPGEDTVTISDVDLINGKYNINLMDYPDFKGHEITVGMNAYFDSGNTGFGVPSSHKALQNWTITGDGSYLSVVNDKLTLTSIAKNSFFTGSLNIDSEQLVLNDKNNSSLNVDIDIERDGVHYQGYSVTFKELKEATFKCTSEPQLIDVLVPSISLLNHETGKLNIIPNLTSVDIKATIKTVEDMIENNVVYYELYKTNNDKTNPVLIDREHFVSVEALTSGVTIKSDDFAPKSYYMIKFYVKINGQEYYLYDEDTGSIAETYYFSTLGNIEVEDVITEFKLNSYNDKSINVSYSLSDRNGISYIKYNLYEKKDKDEYELLNYEIPNTELIRDRIIVDPIAVNPGNEYGISYGKDYAIDIMVYAVNNQNGEEFQVGYKRHDFTFPDAIEPNTIIRANREDKSISFRVNIEDPSKIVSDGKYSVRLKEAGANGLDVYREENVSLNKSFVFTQGANNLINDLKSNTNYEFIVEYYLDYNNSRTDLERVTKIKNFVYADDIIVGDVYAVKNGEDAIDIVFSNSFKLTEIDEIHYSILSLTNNYNLDLTKKLFLTTYNPDNALYTYTIQLDNNAEFKSGNMYVISLRFYDNGELLDDQTKDVNYYYGGE